jgi:hypothetical protein
MKNGVRSRGPERSEGEPMRRVLIACIACLAWSGTAFAEPPPGGYQENQPVQYNDPNAPPPQQQPEQYGDEQQYGQEQQYQEQQYDQYGQPVQYDQYGQPVQAYPQQQPAQPITEPVQSGRGLQYGGTLFVPIYFSDLRDALYPGIGIHGRVGWEVGGGFSFEGGIGAQFNPDRNLYGNLTNVFFTGGVRYAFLNPSALVPFIHAEVMINLWDFCDPFGCTAYSSITAGFAGGGGLIWEINRDAALEVGANVAASSPGTTFFNWQAWVSPFIGVTLYY